MMKCEVVRDIVPMYADKTASAETEAVVREHLKHCPECRKFYGSWIKYETKSEKANREKLCEIADRTGADISELDVKFASLSGKIKKRKTRNTILGILFLLGVAVYITIDIINTVKRKEENKQKKN